MQDWEYCRQMLPKVSRTFALNIAVLKDNLYRSILTAYLFCRIVDTVEDAAELDPRIKIRLLQEFSHIIEDPDYRASNLARWVEECRAVDGSENDLDLLLNTPRVFNVFDSLRVNHREQIIPSVSRMARGMAYFQQKFSYNEITLLEDEHELEEYCYFVAGLVGEMLCNLFFQEIPHLSPKAKETMQRTAVSFGLGLQMTNISKDIIVDRGRGWSYIPRSYITGQGLTVEEFNAGTSINRNLEVMERLLHKTLGHLEDALRFTLAIPRSETRIRLFCIWPLWMAMETVAVLHNNKALLNSDDPVKISRSTVRRILRRTRWLCYSDLLLKWSFGDIKKRAQLKNPPRFDLDALNQRLNRISLDSLGNETALSH
ncbi:squalene/phytoene synthase family protein [Nitrospina gracilis]|uniref:squalene/phytoene synthase family protein n=1 Tax=Nitrospina gracilis TaxID=35801 RepID=UPI001F1AC264|nr:squalene/phytoene synthase family protein [Nitrospina gracilis]MCF8720088.1 farnesyl-diphosphate farnesyltransferase [Nitrospina gracilis Nb-211]